MTLQFQLFQCRCKMASRSFMRPRGTCSNTTHVDKQMQVVYMCKFCKFCRLALPPSLALAALLHRALLIRHSGPGVRFWFALMRQMPGQPL
jgi:hypothetical protein